MHICSSSADTLCKQFGPRSGHDQEDPYHLNFFENVHFEIKSAEHSLKNFPACKELKVMGYNVDNLTLKAPFRTAAEDKFCTSFLVLDKNKV